MVRLAVLRPPPTPARQQHECGIHVV